MARSNHGDNNPSGPLFPYHHPTPPAGMAQPPAGPYGPPVPTPAIPSAAKAQPTPAALFSALRRRWVLATFLGLLAGAALGAGVWFSYPKGNHTARSILQLRSNSIEVGKGQDDFTAFRQSQMYLVRSRDLVNRTLADARVKGLPTFKDKDDDEMVRTLEDGLRVDGTIAPELIAVNFSGDTPDDLVKTLDVLVGRFVDDANNAVRKHQMERIERLEKAADDLRARISSQEAAIRNTATANAALNPEEANAKTSPVHVMIGTLTVEIGHLKVQNATTANNVERLKEKLDPAKFDPAKIAADPLLLRQWVNNHPKVAVVASKKVSKELLLASERPKAAPDAPTIKTLEAELEQLDKDLAAARKDVLPEVKTALAENAEGFLRSQLGDLEERLASGRADLKVKEDLHETLTKNVGQIVRGNFDIQTMLKALEPMRKHLDQLESQRIQVTIEKGMEARVAVREAAVLLMNKNLKQKVFVTSFAGLAGFAGALVLIAFLEWRTRRVDGVDQVVTDLGMRVIGTVPAFPNRASLKAAEAAGNANWRFVLNEAINSTRTMLLHTARSQSMQVVMVTSATQGEGKTSLASQLGSSMATAGMRTLIVDCDLRNPSIHKLFDLTLTPGVSEVLSQEADASDAVQPTAVPNLWVIPAGQCSTRVIAALAQGHPLETLFNRLRGQFDFVVVDCCPVLPVADALLIGQHVDGVLFSIMQDVSQLPKVLVASEKLGQLNIQLLGAVVNGVNMGSAYYAYGYNYVKQLPA